MRGRFYKSPGIFAPWGEIPRNIAPMGGGGGANVLGISSPPYEIRPSHTNFDLKTKRLQSENSIKMRFISYNEKTKLDLF